MACCRATSSTTASTTGTRVDVNVLKNVGSPVDLAFPTSRSPSAVPGQVSDDPAVLWLLGIEEAA